MDIKILEFCGSHEFEKPICFTTDNPNIEFSSKQYDMIPERMTEEAKSMLKALSDKYDQIRITLHDQLVEMIKEMGKLPKGWNPKTDHLMVRNGVIFWARNKHG